MLIYLLINAKCFSRFTVTTVPRIPFSEKEKYLFAFFSSRFPEMYYRESRADNHDKTADHY